MNNYTKVLKHKSRIIIPYVNLEIRGTLNIIIIIFLALIISLPFLIINVWFFITIFVFSSFSFSVIINDYDSDLGALSAQVYVYKIINKKYLKYVKHGNRNVSYIFKRKNKKISKLIYLLDYRGVTDV